MSEIGVVIGVSEYYDGISEYGININIYYRTLGISDIQVVIGVGEIFTSTCSRGMSEYHEKKG